MITFIGLTKVNIEGSVIPVYFKRENSIIKLPVYRNCIYCEEKEVNYILHSLISYPLPLQNFGFDINISTECTCEYNYKFEDGLLTVDYVFYPGKKQ